MEELKPINKFSKPKRAFNAWVALFNIPGKPELPKYQLVLKLFYKLYPEYQSMITLRSIQDGTDQNKLDYVFQRIIEIYGIKLADKPEQELRKKRFKEIIQSLFTQLGKNEDLFIKSGIRSINSFSNNPQYFNMKGPPGYSSRFQLQTALYKNIGRKMKNYFIEIFFIDTKASYIMESDEMNDDMLVNFVKGNIDKGEIVEYCDKKILEFNNSEQHLFAVYVPIRRLNPNFDPEKSIIAMNRKEIIEKLFLDIYDYGEKILEQVCKIIYELFGGAHYHIEIDPNKYNKFDIERIALQTRDLMISTIKYFVFESSQKQFMDFLITNIVEEKGNKPQQELLKQFLKDYRIIDKSID